MKIKLLLTVWFVILTFVLLISFLVYQVVITNYVIHLSLLSRTDAFDAIFYDLLEA